MLSFFLQNFKPSNEESKEQKKKFYCWVLYKLVDKFVHDSTLFQNDKFVDIFDEKTVET